MSRSISAAIKRFCLIAVVVGAAAVASSNIYGQKVRLRSQITPNCPSVSSPAQWKFSDIFADGNIAVQGSYYCRGAFIYDLTNPDAPLLSSWYNPGNNQQFLEAIVVGNRGYFGSGNGGGVHIVDLSRPTNPVLLGTVDSTHGNGHNSIHEMMVISQGGATYLLENYNSTSVRPLRIINVTDPAAPVFKWEWNPADSWVHAYHIRGNRLYTSGYSSGKIEIYDISNLATQAPALVGTIAGTTTNHSAWTSEDGNYLYSCRETLDGDLRVYDVRNPAAPLLVRSIKTSELGLNAVSPHNPVVMGNYLYISWYQAGIQVFDITDPTFPKKIGQYDTFSPTFADPAKEATDTKEGSESVDTKGKIRADVRSVKKKVVDAEPWDIICGAENLQNALPSNYDGNWAIFPFLGQNKILAGDLTNGLLVLDATNVSSILKNRVSDFDGDKRTDLSVYTPNNGVWQFETSSDSLPTRLRFGSPNDILVSGDYNGDGKTDIALYRPSNSTWYIKGNPRAKNDLLTVPFGASGDIPVPADYDADGKTDIAVWRPSNATWYISQSTLGQKIQAWGAIGDKPITGDYDGDGKADIGVWHRADGTWSILRSSSSLTLAATLGQAGDKPVTADFDGNGISDLAVFRPSNGTWYALDPITGVTTTFQWGTAGDVPIPADYDGDGKSDFTVFRPSTNQWLRYNSSNGATVTRTFGQTGDTPSPSSVQPQ